jgi:hypothetical protein
MLFSCDERKIYKKTVIYVYINVFISVMRHRISYMCLCVKYEMVLFNMCVRLGSITVSAYAFRNT